MDLNQKIAAFRKASVKADREITKLLNGLAGKPPQPEHLERIYAILEEYAQKTLADEEKKQKHLPMPPIAKAA